MGGSKKYIDTGGFEEQTYKQIGTTSNDIKIVKKIGEDNSNTPMFSNTPYTMYAVLNSEDNILKQISIYGGKDGRQKIKDIDYGHEHTNINGNGMHFAKNEIHVQRYIGMKRLTNQARKPSKKEKRIFMMALQGRR